MMTIFRGILFVFIQPTYRLNGHFIFYFIIHFLESQSTQDFWERMKQLCSIAHFLSHFTVKDILQSGRLAFEFLGICIYVHVCVMLQEHGVGYVV